MRDIHLSIVSHGQDEYVRRLVASLSGLRSVDRFQATLIVNIPESGQLSYADCAFPLSIVNNALPLGFGANHNLGFRSAPFPDERRYFVVLNPDLIVRHDVMAPLIDELEASEDVGVIAPAVCSATGELEDSAREMPTWSGLLKKAFGRKGRQVGVDLSTSFRPDWVAGMFMLFPCEVFSQIDGFDEGFFLYYEDVDICSRLWINGYAVLVDPRHSIVHEAQRSSHKSWRYARWHLSSIARFLSSSVYRRARRFHRGRAGRPRFTD